MEAIVTLDIGTTGCKAAMVSREGAILHRDTIEYTTSTQGSQVEQNPDDWWRAAQTSLNRLMKKLPQSWRVIALTLSGQMQNVILLGDEELLSPAILYSDRRAKSEADEIARVIGEETLLEVTRNLQDATSLLAKCLWLKHHKPELYASAKTLLIGAHDTIAWKICRTRTTDYTTAATTGLLDLDHNQWAISLLEMLDLRTDWLPDLRPAGALIGEVNPAAAAVTGLPVGLPVYQGLGDAASATLGAGAGEPGSYYAYLGTSGWLAGTITGKPVDPRNGIFNLRHPSPQKLILIGPLLCAAGNFEWLRRQFGDLEVSGSTKPGIDAYQCLNEMAAMAPAGSSGLLYMPHLNGERAPFRDPDARGVFFGLSVTSSRAELYRSVLEGVAFAMRSIRDRAFPTGEMNQLSLVGGGAKSHLWSQIFADIFNCPVQVLGDADDVGTRGAALSAGKALGWYDSFNPPGFFPIESTYEPRPNDVQRYEQLYPVYSGLYPALTASFKALAEIYS